MILDTNALSDFLRATPELLAHLEKAEWPCLPVIVLGEYRFGGRFAGKTRIVAKTGGV